MIIVFCSSLSFLAGIMIAWLMVTESMKRTSDIPAWILCYAFTMGAVSALVSGLILLVQ